MKNVMYVKKIPINELHRLEKKVTVVDEHGPFDANLERHRLKIALSKGPCYATYGRSRFMISAAGPE